MRVGAEAYDRFFDTGIRKLTHSFPRDLGMPGGPPNIDKDTGLDQGPFWRGRKRFPRPGHDRSSKRYQDFVFHTACIMCDVLGVPRPGAEEVAAAAAAVPQVVWTPEAGRSDDDESLETLLERLNAIPTTGKAITEMEFEKDDDDNHHIEWIAAACNERSHNYYIEESTAEDVRVTAGNILAAIATATASICGIQMIEVTKLLLGVDRAKHKGLTMDLSTCNFVLEDMADVVKFTERQVVEDESTGATVLHKVPTEKGFSVWDTLKVRIGAGASGLQLAAHIRALYPDVVAREFYASGLCLWTLEGASAGEPALFKAFKEAKTSGKKTAGHSVKTIKRVRNELKDLEASPLPGVEVFVNEADIFNLNLLIAGPSNSPYAKGLFRVAVNIPTQYPLTPPTVTFKTKIFHCNVAAGGSPCPNLLYGAEWSPKKNLRYMLVQVLELLVNQSPGDSLNTDAGQLYNKSTEEFAAAAGKFADEHANPQSERALMEAALRAQAAEHAAAAAQSGGGAAAPEAFEWPHKYLVLEGDFGAVSNPNAVYDLPRIQLFLEDEGDGAAAAAGGGGAAAAAGGGGAAAAAAAAATPLDADSKLSKAILATKFEIEETEFTPQRIFHMSDERAALYLKAAGKPAGSFTVAVVCMNEEEEKLEEIVLLIPDGEAAIAEASPGLDEDTYSLLTVADLILGEDTSVSNCVEYRFGPEDSWTVCQTSGDNMANFRAIKFELYQKQVREVPVPCLKTLSRLLANGPVDRLYDPNFLNPDREAWQVLNEDTGKVTDVPRPVTEMRTWNCETQAYEDFDTRLAGAPAPGEAAHKWFVDNVVYVKTNLGGQNSSLPIAQMWSDELNAKVAQLGFSNQWTDIVHSLNPTAEWAGLSE